MFEKLLCARVEALSSAFLGPLSTLVVTISSSTNPALV